MDQEEQQAAEAEKSKATKKVVAKKETAPKLSLRGLKHEGYEPIHMLRCHSIENDPTDAKTNVWKCQFEPDPENPSKKNGQLLFLTSNTIMYMYDLV